jgi:hypothetical protein
MSEDTTFDRLTLFAEDFHASLTVLPGSEQAQQMTVTSGRKCAALLTNSDPVGYLLKTLLESEQLFSMQCYLTWRIWVTPRGRLLFRLQASVPRTRETGYGLWPTMTAQDAHGHAQTAENKTPGQTGGTTLPGAVRLYPTIMATEARLGYQRRDDNSKRKQQSLTTIVVDSLLPTLKARDFRTGDKPEHRRARLKRTGEWHSPDLNDVVAPGGQLNPEWAEWFMGYPIGWTELVPSETP